jgi:hypothetical protein
MTTPSLLSSVGLDIGLYDRTGSIFRKKLNQYIGSYTHTIDAVGGFGASNIGMSMIGAEALYLFEQLLAGRIKVTCEGGRIVYEGSINSVGINAGSETETIGALFDIGNRVSITYSPTDYTVYPPVAGSTITSLITEDLDSQARYGIIEKILSMGQTTDATEALAQAVALQEAAYPNRSGDISLSPGGGQPIALTIDCVGLKNWFTAYIYNNTNGGLITLDQKIEEIITAEVNNYISRDFSKIAAHLYACPEEESKDRYAWDILSEVLALGNDTTDDRRNFGVYENGRCFYETIPNTISYRHLLSDPKQCIMDNNAMGTIIPPWLLRPGKFLIVPDFITNSIPDISTNLRKDPRIKFLESVSYTAPWSVNLSGGKTDKLSQMLAKITYSGGIY